MTIEERAELLDSLKDKIQSLDEMVHYIGLDIEGKFYDSIRIMIDHSIKMTAIVINVSQDSIEWFIYENDWGFKGYTCNISDKEYKIESSLDFLKFEDLLEQQ